MELEKLYAQIEKRKKLSAEGWAKAALIGEARRKSNERKRADRRDRGPEKNRLNDLMGSAGELFLYKAMEEAEVRPEALSYIRAHMFNPEGGGGEEEPDAWVTNSEGRCIGIDVKTFDRRPNKKFFAINKQKHEALRGKCDYYYCFVAPPCGAYVALAMVPYHDLDVDDLWREKEFGDYDDPAISMPFAAFQAKYLGGSIGAAILLDGSCARGESAQFEQEVNRNYDEQVTPLMRDEKVRDSIRNEFPQIAEFLK